MQEEDERLKRTKQEDLASILGCCFFGTKSQTLCVSQKRTMNIADLGLSVQVEKRMSRRGCRQGIVSRLWERKSELRRSICPPVVVLEVCLSRGTLYSRLCSRLYSQPRDTTTILITTRDKLCLVMTREISYDQND